MFIQSRDPVRPKDELSESNAPKALSPQWGTPAADIGEDASHLSREHSRKEVQECNTAASRQHPSTAPTTNPSCPAIRQELANSCAKAAPFPTTSRGIFGIRLLDRTRAESQVQDVSINIDPGSQTTGIAVVTDDGGDKRTVLGAYEINHRAFALKATMTRRCNFRCTRRCRLRYRNTL